MRLGLILEAIKGATVGARVDEVLFIGEVKETTYDLNNVSNNVILYLTVDLEGKLYVEDELVNFKIEQRHKSFLIRVDTLDKELNKSYDSVVKYLFNEVNKGLTTLLGYIKDDVLEYRDIEIVVNKYKYK